jgi:hypothetical protein
MGDECWYVIEKNSLYTFTKFHDDATVFDCEDAKNVSSKLYGRSDVDFAGMILVDREG